MNKNLKSLLKVLMFLSIGIIILYIVYRVNNAKFLEECRINGTPLSDCNLIDKIFSDVQTANFTWVFIALGFYVWSNIARAIRWRMLIGITLILSFDNFVGYFKGSDLFNGEGSSFFSPLNITILGLLSLASLLLIWKYREKILATKIGKKIWDIILGFWEGILTIKDLRSPAKFIFHTVTIWICYYLMTYLMFFSFAPVANLEAVAGLVVFVFGTLGIVIPSPGGMGTYQFLISEGLVLYNIPAAEAFSFANIMFFSVQLTNVALGLIAFVLLPIINKND